MKLSNKKFKEILSKVEKELKKINDDSFSCVKDKKKFQFDYHYTYPPAVVTLFFEWDKGEVSGKRTASWVEGPMMPEFVELDDNYLKGIFNLIP